MDEAAQRGLTSQLSDDLAWLENHARGQPEEARHAGALRLAAALVRNVVGPFIEGQAAPPLHVAVVGGAGAGKSTVANFLCGAILAESNPQAGFTRHPTAYASAAGQQTWPAHLGFLGPLRRLPHPAPGNLDADVYQVKKVPADDETVHVLDKFIVWDCPDMTTWAAQGYVSRLIEVAGLADVIVYVASDERYNDAVPTEFLKLLLQAGKVVVVCLVKMKEADAPAFVEHFQKEVIGKMPVRAISCLAIPQLTQAQLADPARLANPFRIPLVNQVTVLGEPPAATRRRTVHAALRFLQTSQDSLLGGARQDLAALGTWRNLVQEGQKDFDLRYRREYLTGEQFRRFDEALVKLLELLELPGVGKILSGALYVVRTPYRLLKGLLSRGFQRPHAAALPERPVMEGAFHGWLDLLRKEAARRGPTHPLWVHLQQGFATGMAEKAQEQFEQCFRTFQLSQADEVDRTARAIYEDLAKNPVALNTLRGSKFALEVASITGAIVMGGINLVDIVLVPLAASITHQLVELLGKSYVENQRELARARQEALATKQVSAPLADWLINWPSSGGSSFEQLQTILRRLPQDIQKLETLVRKQESALARV